MKGVEVSGDMCHAWKRREIFTGHSWGNLKIYLEDNIKIDVKEIG